MDCIHAELYASSKEKKGKGLHNNKIAMKKFLFGFIMMSLFASCATKKRIIETENIKTEVKTDTSDIQSVKIDSDTVSHKTEKTEKEKVEVETKVEKSDSTVMIVDTNGNVIKQEKWHKEKETVSRNREYEKLLSDSVAHLKSSCDSLRQYVSKCDSLQEKLSHKEYITVEKIKIPKWSWYCLGFTIIVIIFAGIKIVKWLR